MARGRARQTCLRHTVSTQTHSSQPVMAIMKAPPAVIISCSFRKKKKKAAVDSVAADVMKQNINT